MFPARKRMSIISARALFSSLYDCDSRWNFLEHISWDFFCLVWIRHNARRRTIWTLACAVLERNSQRSNGTLLERGGSLSLERWSNLIGASVAHLLHMHISGVWCADFDYMEKMIWIHIIHAQAHCDGDLMGWSLNTTDCIANNFWSTLPWKNWPSTTIEFEVDSPWMNTCRTCYAVMDILW